MWMDVSDYDICSCYICRLCDYPMGSSTNHAKPVPVINLVLALKKRAATIIKIINIASTIDAEASKLLIARNVFIF